MLGVGVLVCGVLVPLSVSARHPHAHHGPFGLCHRCFMPQLECCCPAPAVNPCGACAHPVVQPMQQPVFQTQLRPVLETTYQPQQVVTYQDVPQVQHLRQAVTVNVPVTTFQNVTVDEGSYQMVWVPRPVQKQVAQTVLQPQIQYRDVAVQVNQRVAQTHTQLVPQQTLRYVPETRQIGMQPIGSRVIGYQYGARQFVGWQPGIGVQPTPMTAGLPTFTLPGEPVPGPVPEASQPIERPTPNPQHLQTPAPAETPAAPATSEWQTIRQRTSASLYNPPQQPQTASGIPSAATVWQSHRETPAVVR
jgi:hypothetical protein